MFLQLLKYQCVISIDEKFSNILIEIQKKETKLTMEFDSYCGENDCFSYDFFNNTNYCRHGQTLIALLEGFKLASKSSEEHAKIDFYLASLFPNFYKSKL